MKKIEQAQKFLTEMKIDGWLLYDFHGNNPLARTFLDLTSTQLTTRRFFYWIPQSGKPIKIVHKIEEHSLDHLLGEKRCYLSWQSLEKELEKILKNTPKVAMEYSFKNQIPYISKVDAGTVDLVQSFGAKVVSSKDFLLHFTSILSKEQGQSHIRAAKACEKIVNKASLWVKEMVFSGKKITEYDVQQKILEDFSIMNLTTDHPPIVAVGPHSADPHYEPKQEKSSLIKKGDFFLIDLWAKERGEKTVFGDITRVFLLDSKPQEKQQKVFSIVRQAQKMGVSLIKERLAHNERIEGWEVDERVRGVIKNTGFGDYFVHRTGHSIEVELHGSGTHMDNLEMKDTRPILPNTCFSIEPGIYLPNEFGVRLEHDIYIHDDKTVEITGGEQDAIVLLHS